MKTTRQGGRSFEFTQRRDPGTSVEERWRLGTGGIEPFDEVRDVTDWICEPLCVDLTTEQAVTLYNHLDRFGEEVDINLPNGGSRFLQAVREYAEIVEDMVVRERFVEWEIVSGLTRQ